MKNDKTKLGLAFAVVGGSLILLGVVGICRYWWNDGPKGPEVVRLRLKWTHQGQFAGFYVAQRLGYYAKEGLKVEIVPGGQDLNAVRLVASGKDQFGVWGAEQLMIARSNEIKVVALGVVYQDTAACFVYKPGSSIQSFKDIEGKRVGVQHGTDQDTIYHALASINNVDLSTVTEIPAQYSFVPFLTNQADVWPCYVVNEPFIAKKNKVPIEILYPKKNGLRFYGDTIFCAEDFARKNENTVKAFMRATLRGWEYALDNPDEAAQICVEVDAQLDKEHQIYMIKESTPLIRVPGDRLLRMTDGRWMEIHNVLKDQGLIKRDVSVSEVYKNDYLPD